MGKYGDVQLHAAVPPQHSGAAIERGAGREYIINKDVALPCIQAGARSECKGIFEVVPARAPVEGGLALRIRAPHKDIHHNRRSAGRPRESLREEGALIEAAFPTPACVERHGHKRSSPHMFNYRRRAAENLLHVLQDVPAAVVLEFDQQRPGRTPQEHGCTARAKRGIEAGAMLAGARAGKVAQEGMPACLAERGPGELQIPGASRAHVPVRAVLDQSAAIDASRRKNDIGQAPQESPWKGCFHPLNKALFRERAPGAGPSARLQYDAAMPGSPAPAPAPACPLPPTQGPRPGFSPSCKGNRRPRR